MQDFSAFSRPDFLNTKDIFTQARQAIEVENEMKLHVAYCEKFGVAIENILATAEHPACFAYTNFLTKVAAREDYLPLQVALSPCSLGYQIIGRSLLAWDETNNDSNPYWSWIEYYGGNEYADNVRDSLLMLEKYAAREPRSSIADLVDIFVEAIELEVNFWNIGLQGGPER